jgi:predicted enzyme related to lactoylglutathione lyase
MSSTPGEPRGLGGLRYHVTQVSLVVRDLPATMAAYQRAFGWQDWKVFDHVEPTHHGTELRGERVPYSLRGAEVMVGGLNFELLQPLEGPSVWKEFLDARGEGIASIAVMFDTVEESEIVKAEFAKLGIDVTMRALIGDHIEYYYLDTQERFGCLIESGSGHAIDFVAPASVFAPVATAEPTPAVAYDHISQISVVVRDLDATMAAYHEAFGWGPWKVFQSDGEVIMHDCRIDGEPCDFFNVRWAEVDVDGLNFELIQPISGDNPWQRILDAHGEGIGSIAVMFKTEAESDAVKRQFAQAGIGITASARIGDQIEWYYLDTEPTFKCLIESGSGHAMDFMRPVAVYP